ncbi:10635_t:CDS:2, partial [Ambispora gerdemannii]
PDPSKVEKVQNYPVPENITTLREFIGLALYYQCFIKDFTKIHLTTSPILTYPNFDKPFILFTDASSIGLGAVLSQKDSEGREKVIAYANRRVNETEA